MLAVNDFDIKFKDPKDTEYLINTLCEKHDITIDWNGIRCAELALQWDYDKETFNTSLPNCVPKDLNRFGMTKPTYPIHAPQNFAQNKINNQQPIQSSNELVLLPK